MSQFVTTSSDRQRRPRIGITVGDPAGIGPEISLKAITDESLLNDCLPILIGDARYLIGWAEKLDLAIDLRVLQAASGIPADLIGPAIYSLDNINGDIEMGRESAASGRASAEYVEAGSAALSPRRDRCHRHCTNQQESAFPCRLSVSGTHRVSCSPRLLR